jgi:hypothetical protein
MVLSNSFHGTAFSIIFEKEFYVFSLNKYKINSRMTDLLSLLELEKRHISSKDEIINEVIDYNRVYALLNNKVLESYQYIEKITNL